MATAVRWYEDAEAAEEEISRRLKERENLSLTIMRITGEVVLPGVPPSSFSDPWGNPWCYDLGRPYSAGPNGVPEFLRGDDVAPDPPGLAASCVLSIGWLGRGGVFVGVALFVLARVRNRRPQLLKHGMFLVAIVAGVSAAFVCAEVLRLPILQPTLDRLPPGVALVLPTWAGASLAVGGIVGLLALLGLQAWIEFQKHEKPVVFHCSADAQIQEL
ncbi:MAG: hypothetical protein M9894_27795 [Planctomycetes bacterium]|nr:hypothetical protein [Planctomycetota bacterium]